MALSEHHKKLLSRLQPVDRPRVACTTCIPTVDGSEIEHAESCPISIDVEAATESDRIWFENHPDANYYYRPVSWGEGAQLITRHEKLRKLPGAVKLEPAGKVRIEQIEIGSRIRSFEAVYFIVATD